jgi:threonine dehydratase
MMTNMSMVENIRTNLRPLPAPSGSHETPAISPFHIERALKRIQPFLRQTPVLPLHVTRETFLPCDIWLKLENMQMGGSFKVRGALNKVLQIPEAERKKRLVTASGGHHGVAVAYAGLITGMEATVFVGHQVGEDRHRHLQSWGAKIMEGGNDFSSALQMAEHYAAVSGAHFIHPFADPDIIAGQGTLGLELIDQMPDPDIVLMAIGGGGLIGGVALAIKNRYPMCRIIGVEAAGAPLFWQARQTGNFLPLSHIATKATSIAIPSSTLHNHHLIESYVDDILLVPDSEMIASAAWLQKETSLRVDLAAAATLNPLLKGQIFLPKGGHVAAVLCGAEIGAAPV